MHPQSVEVSDDEIVADLFRLAKSGRFKRLVPLLKEAEEQYPAETPGRIKACMRRLGEALWAADYQGYRSEYHLHRRPKAHGQIRVAP